MKVTEKENKDRELREKDYRRMVSAERKEYVGVSAESGITEKKVIITNFQTDELLEKILQRDNINMAYKKVKSNKGAGGIDKMSVEELLPYLKENQAALVQKLREGRYKPNPVRRV